MNTPHAPIPAFPPVGSRIRHSKYGHGTVVGIGGRNRTQYTIEVRFEDDDHNTRELYWAENHAFIELIPTTAVVRRIEDDVATILLLLRYVHQDRTKVASLIARLHNALSQEVHKALMNQNRTDIADLMHEYELRLLRDEKSWH